MSNGRKYTDLDLNQTSRLVFDVEKEATRVVLVGGGEIKLEVDPSNITNSIKEGLSAVKMTQETISIPTIVKEFVEVKVPVIVKEQVIERIEVPVVTTEVKLVEVPVIIEKIVNHVVEKPIVLEKIIEKVPKYIYYIMGIEALLIVVLSIMLRSN